MTSTQGPAARTTLDAVGKALRVLTLLGDFPHGVSISELARATGFPVSTTHRLLRSLANDGYVSADPDTRHYHVGLRVFELGQKVSQARGFGGMALPVLEEVVAQTGETALLGARVGDEQLFVHTVPSPRPVQIQAAPGTRRPMHCTAMGKVMVAYSTPSERDRLVHTLPLLPLTPKTITDREVFATEIALTAERGYATALEEHDVGVNAIAVPVLDRSGNFLAAVACAAPASRIGPEQLVTLRPSLLTAADRLGILLPRR